MEIVEDFSCETTFLHFSLSFLRTPFVILLKFCLFSFFFFLFFLLFFFFFFYFSFSSSFLRCQNLIDFLASSAARFLWTFLFFG